MKTRKDRVYEVIAILALIIGFIAYAIYNHDHTVKKYTTIPNTTANEHAADQSSPSGNCYSTENGC